MSHISSYKTEIKLDNALSAGRSVEEDPGWDVLNEAVHATAEEMNLDATRSFKDYYGRLLRVTGDLWDRTSPGASA